MELFFDDEYKGFGHSEGLARGIQFSYHCEDLTQEGMGIGAIAAKQGRRTVFSSSYNTLVNKEAGTDSEIIVRTYQFDTILLTGFKNRHSEKWTKFRDGCIETYKRHIKSQNHKDIPLMECPYLINS